MPFEFATANRIRFGNGAFEDAGEIAAGMGKRALVVTGLRGAGADELHAQLSGRGIHWLDVQAHGEPTILSVQQGLEAARAFGAEFGIALGGGSVIDTGKAITAMLTNPGELLDYLEVVGRGQKLANMAAPLIAIPTTSGTGSEVTRNAVLGVPESKVKVSLRSPLMIPRVALIDPELTLSLPQEATASTGMDALTQVLEPYVSVRSNRLTDLYCREGLQRGAKWLVQAYRQGDDLKAREEMAWTSLLGGLALANAGLGTVHGFASVIGGMFTAPHGAVCARLLPLVTSMNIQALQQRKPGDSALRRYEEIAASAYRTGGGLSGRRCALVGGDGSNPTDSPALGIWNDHRGYCRGGREDAGCQQHKGEPDCVDQRRIDRSYGTGVIKFYALSLKKLTASTPGPTCTMIAGGTM